MFGDTPVVGMRAGTMVGEERHKTPSHTWLEQPETGAGVKILASKYRRRGV